MINIEVISLIVEAIKGRVNFMLYLLKLKEKPVEQEKQEPLPKKILRTTSVFIELYFAIRASILLLAQLSAILSQPSMAALAIIALTPPPVIVALYGITALYQCYKITTAILKIVDKRATEQQRRQARLELLHAILVFTAALAIITSNFIFPGATNILALSCILTAASFKAGQYVYTFFTAKRAALQQDAQSDLSLFEEHQKNHSRLNKKGENYKSYETKVPMPNTKLWNTESPLEKDALQDKTAAKYPTILTESDSKER